MGAALCPRAMLLAGTPQHDEATHPCRGAGPKLLAPARGQGAEQKLRSWRRVPAKPQQPLSPLSCSGPSSWTFWIHTRGGDIPGAAGVGASPALTVTIPVLTSHVGVTLPAGTADTGRAGPGDTGPLRATRHHI